MKLNCMSPNYSSRVFTVHDGQQYHLNFWTTSTPVGWVVIVHGMAEHGLRYARLAEKLVTQGWNVCVPDLRGHGKTSELGGRRGFFSRKGGRLLIIKDVQDVIQEVLSTSQLLPVVLLGHSMGAQIALAVALRDRIHLNGLVLSALAPPPGPILNVGLALAWIQGLIFGKTAKSNLLNTMTFGRFKGGIKNPRTAFDWLSRDPAEVDKYIADKDCGEVFSNRFFYDLFSMVKFNQREVGVFAFYSEMRTLFLAGSDDPVIIDEDRYLAWVHTIAAEMNHVSIHMEEGGRHELLNDVCRDGIEDRLINWLGKNFEGEAFRFPHVPA